MVSRITWSHISITTTHFVLRILLDEAIQWQTRKLQVHLSKGLLILFVFSGRRRMIIGRYVRYIIHFARKSTLTLSGVLACMISVDL